MNLITLDFETYYADDYSLTKMSTEEYVNDPRFHIMLVGAKINDDKPISFSGPMSSYGAWLDKIGLWDSCMVAHNAMFDALILAVWFKRLPKMILCTRMMAQPTLRPYMRSVSLEQCLLKLDLGINKGTEVHNMKGRPLASLSRQELIAYAKYCMDDCEGTYRLFKHLLRLLPRDELQIIDRTLRMYLEPQLELDAEQLAQHLQDVRAKKAQQMASLPPSITPDMLASNPKFAQLLQAYGVDPPTKISLTTGDIAYAFSKNDTGWKELEDEYADDPLVSAILTARLGAKSTLEESRTERLLSIANTVGKFRVPIMYCAAHTHRDGGMEDINAQNLPRVDKSRMRYAVKAPKGRVVLAADLAQIEARITAWLAGQKDLLQDFRNNIDIYSKFASRVFKYTVTKANKAERFVGKTCILGLGFGMGPPKLRATLRKDGLIFSLPETTNMVTLYRGDYSLIPAMWGLFDGCINIMSMGGKRQFGPLMLGDKCIVLPNGMALNYHDLKYMDGKNKKGYRGWAYSFAGETRTLWGGKIAENCVQALARIVVMTHMLEIEKQTGLRPVLRQHDELDYVVPESEAESLSRQIIEIMSVPPSWAPDLPVAVEVNYGPSLGDCK